MNEFKNENRRFEGIWIPKELWFSRELTLQEKIFFVEIKSLDNENGCFASNSYFADFFGISKSRCSQVITSLQNKGLVTIDFTYSKTNPKEIDKRIIRCCGKYSKGGSKYPKGGYLENAKDNSTNINSTVNKRNLNKEKISNEKFDPCNLKVKFDIDVLTHKEKLARVDAFVKRFSEEREWKETFMRHRKMTSMDKVNIALNSFIRTQFIDADQVHCHDISSAKKYFTNWYDNNNPETRPFK